MRQPKKRASRGSGWLRGAIVGVRSLDCRLAGAGYIVVSTTAATRFGRDHAPAGAVMVRPCCVLELRSCSWSDGTRTRLFVTHLDGECEIATDESAHSLMARLGRYGRTVAHVA